MRERVSLRGVILLLFVVSVLYALTFVRPVAQTFDDIVRYVSGDGQVVVAWAAGAVLVLAGHVLRAYRDTLLFSKAADTNVKSQLGAFSVGALCSAVLPLKLGEFVRADVVAQRYRISYSFTFALVCVERLVDALVLLALSAVVVGFYPPLAVIAVVLAAVVWVLWVSPSWLKRLLSSVGRLLDDRVEARLYFVFWSLEYGLRRTFVPRVIVPYLLLSLANWAVYVAAFMPVLSCVSGEGFLGCAAASVGAYVALTTAITPAALGSYTAVLAGFGLADPVAYIMLWMEAIVPISLVGLFFACFKLRGLPLLRSRVAAAHAEAGNKLSRSADVSADQLGFLKDYYAGRELAHKVAHNEIVGGPAVERYLSGGGSGAVTFLADDGGASVVTKVVPSAKSNALREQYSWLRAHAGPMVVEAVAERDDGETYSIDVGFEPECVDAFDYVHACSAGERLALLDQVVEMLALNVWEVDCGLKVPESDDARQRVERYLQKHVDESLALAFDALSELGPLLAAEEVVVNGERCANVASLVDRIRGDERILADLCSFRSTPSIHGDLILDNVVWSPGKGCPVVLDPVPCGNFFDGPVFDFGKLSQSLQVGYEFMLRDTSAVEVMDCGEGVVAVSYADLRSAAYEQMWRYVADDLAARYLTEPERRTMLFIGATNYLRRMKHQAVQCPANAPKFYAAGVLYLNRYVRMFDYE